MYHTPLRQTEGLMRTVFHLCGLDRDLAPDYTTICRRRRQLRVANVPDVLAGSDRATGQTVVVIIDSTGARIDQRAGYCQDRWGGDPRRGKYLKVHVGIDADTGQIIAWDITRSEGKGSGDPSVAPDLIDQAYQVAQKSGAHLGGGLGDGAYDSTECYKRMRRYGGRWYAPSAQSPTARQRSPGAPRRS